MIFYIIYFFISSFFFVVIHIGKYFFEKINHHVKNEKKIFLRLIEILHSEKANSKKILLFHAASAGEFEQIKPILEKINRNKYFIIQSFTSSTVYTAESKNTLFDISCYHPYDIWWKSYIFFKRIKPNAYIITRHDIWPMHLLIAKLLNIKIIYINANIHKKSVWIHPAMKLFSKAIFNNIDLCIVPSERIKVNLLSIFPNDKIIIIADSRFNQVFNRYLLNKDKAFLPDYFKKTNNIIFGSYDYQDLKLIYNTIIHLYPDGDQSLMKDQSKIILVPHEININSINQLVIQLNKKNFSIELYSLLKNKATTPNIVIIDCIGVLADIYKYSYLAYIGGGFTRGVHSVLEPGIYGCAISFGPNIEILDELQDIYNLKLGSMIQNEQDLISVLQTPVDECKKQGNKLKDFIINNNQSADKILALIESKINV